MKVDPCAGAQRLAGVQQVELEEVKQSDFDAWARGKDFTEGPFVSTFGDRYGEPYNPCRQAWGLLQDGRVVWAILVRASEPR